MRGFILAGALAMAACGLGGVAHAQEPAQDDLDGEDYCVYLKLTDTFDYELVAEALLAGLDEEKAREAVKKAGEACQSEYSMSADQLALAADIGIFGSTADYLMDELMADGVSDDAIDGLYAVIDEMSDDDLDLVFDGGWRDDAAMKARLKTAVIAKGIPDKAEMLEDSYMLIVVSALGMDAAMSYLMDDMSDFDEEES